MFQKDNNFCERNPALSNASNEIRLNDALIESEQ